MVVLRILRLLISFGVFIVALFTFLDKKDKKYPHPVCQQGEAAYVRTKPYSKASTMEWVLSLCLYYKLDVYLFQAILYMLDINKKSDRKCNHFFQSLISIYVFLCLLIKMKKALNPLYTGLQSSLSFTGAEGFEPSLTVLETAILPLEDAPKLHKTSDNIKENARKVKQFFGHPYVTCKDFRTAP